MHTNKNKIKYLNYGKKKNTDRPLKDKYVD